MVEVVLGGARSGKSKIGLARFCEKITANGEARAMWILPHRSLARTLRLRVAQKVGAVSQLKILTLDDLARLIFQTSFSSKEVLSDFGRALLISALLAETKEPQLQGWREKKKFVPLLAKAIDELKENLLWPKEAPAHFAQAYEAILAKYQFVDRKSMVAAAVRYLQQDKSFCQREGIDLILFYGFTTFSPLEWKLVSAFMQQVSSWFSLTALPDQPKVFAPSLSTLDLIRKEFQVCSPHLAEEKGAFPKPRVLQFSNHDSELEWIARECARLHHQEGIPLHEMALISGAGGGTGVWVEQIFARYSLPLQSLAAESMRHQPLLRQLGSKEEIEIFKSVLNLPSQKAQKQLAARAQSLRSMDELDKYPELKPYARNALLDLDFRPPPHRTSAVHFYGVEAPPLESYRVVFLAHLLEGSLPRKAAINLFSQESVLSEKEHAERERLHFYHLVTRAQEKLILSYSQKSAQGQEELPSLYLKEWPIAPEKIASVTPKLDSLNQEMVLSEMKLFFLRRKESRLHDPLLLEKIKQRLQTGASITQLEAFGKCPFLHFAGNLLRLQEEKSETWARERGSMAHEVLAELGPHLILAKVDLLIAEMRQYVEKKFAALNFPFTAGELALEKERLIQLLEVFLKKEKERLQERGDLPCYFEKPFGSDGIPRYQLSIADDFKLSLRGRIDRVDLTEDGEEAIVIDYKSGVLPTPKAMDEGSNLQIPLYLDVCEQVLGLKPKEGFYLSLKENKQSGVKAKDLKMRVEQMRRHLVDHAVKISQGVTAPEPTDSTLCALCSYRTICRTTEEVF